MKSTWKGARAFHPRKWVRKEAGPLGDSPCSCLSLSFPTFSRVFSTAQGGTMSSSFWPGRKCSLHLLLHCFYSVANFWNFCDLLFHSLCQFSNHVTFFYEFKLVNSVSGTYLLLKHLDSGCDSPLEVQNTCKFVENFHFLEDTCSDWLASRDVCSNRDCLGKEKTFSLIFPTPALYFYIQSDTLCFLLPKIF